MARRDYSDDDDYYTQGFERDGVVSIWVQLDKSGADEDVDALQDCCGVGYYSLDDQEGNQLGEVVELEKLLEDISYSQSFGAAAIAQANKIGIFRAYWLLAQFDFAYDPSRVRRQPTNELVFIGSFPYVRNKT